MKMRFDWYYLLPLVYLLGFIPDIMDIDAAQYANMSREMLQRGDFLHFYDLGVDYIDKPPLVFWTAALSMKIFGINNFAFKFPSFLAALLAIYSIKKLARVYYSEQIAHISAWILATSQAMFLITNDCRTDTLLMGFVALTMWQLAKAFQTNQKKHFFWGFVGIGMAMLAKGPIGVIAPVLAFGIHFLIKKEWKQLFRWEYLVGIVVVLVVLLPMCIGLYQQFDMARPAKFYNGLEIKSGLRFFFWTQSFGRITGESNWDNGANIFFLLQNMLWAFLPWVLFFIGAVIYYLRHFRQQTEYITLGGFLLTYWALGSSRYQLPHYIFVVFPLAAILTARFWVEFCEGNSLSLSYSKIKKGLFISQWVLLFLLWILVVILAIGAFPLSIFATFLLLLSIIALFYTQKNNIFSASIWTAIGVNIFLSLHFYPTLLQYQAGSEMGKYLKGRDKKQEVVYNFQIAGSRMLNFYSNKDIAEKQDIRELSSPCLLITDDKGLSVLQRANPNVEILKKQPHFAVTRLSLPFLNPMTREKMLKMYYIIRW